MVYVTSVPCVTHHMTIVSAYIISPAVEVANRGIEPQVSEVGVAISQMIGACNDGIHDILGMSPNEIFMPSVVALQNYYMWAVYSYV